MSTPITTTSLISRLSTDEIRSIMQLLDHTELLKLARCSRQMLVDATSDAAWKYQNTITVHLNPQTQTNRISTLFSHAPSFSVEWRPTTEVNCIDAMLAIPRVTEMNFIRNMVPSGYWRRLSENNGLPLLRALTILIPEGASFALDWRPLELPPEFFEFLAGRPHLTRLDLGDAVATPSLAQLSTLSHLRSLKVKVADYSDGRLYMPAYVEQCASLRELHLAQLFMHQTMLTGRQFRSFFTSPNIHLLERLTLENFSIKDESNESLAEYSNVFLGLDRLTHLELVNSCCINQLLSAVVNSFSLRSVIIRDSVGGDRQNILPRLDLLQSLFTRLSPSQSSSFHLTILVTDHSPSVTAAQLTSYYGQLQDARFSFEIVEPPPENPKGFRGWTRRACQYFTFFT